MFIESPTTLFPLSLPFQLFCQWLDSVGSLIFVFQIGLSWTLIILLMLYQLLLIALLQIVLAEKTDFDYKDHGLTWNASGCQNGTKQSPIVLSHSVAAAPSYLFGAYNPVNASIDFYDTTTYISGNFGEVYTMTIDKKGLPFKATEIRLRCESEHVIKFDGKDTFTRYPLELQIFHILIEQQSTNDKVAIAIQYDKGETADPIIQKIIDAQVNQQDTIEIDLSYYIKRANIYNYWLYLGSQTIPNCLDGKMNWVVIDHRFSISGEQAEYFHKQFYGRKQIAGNYRTDKTTKGGVGYYTFGS